MPIAEAEARFNEALDVIVKSWTSKQRFSHHGKYWNFEDIIVEPPTAQKPHPPMWMGAGNPDSIRQVAERGYNLLLDQFASFEAVAERIAIFKEAVEERGRVFDPMEVGVARAYYVAKNQADKDAALERRLEAQRRLRGDFERARRHQEQGQHHDLSPTPARRAKKARFTARRTKSRGKIEELQRLGVEYVLLNGGGLGLARRETIFSRFAREVMPAFADEARARVVG